MIPWRIVVIIDMFFEFVPNDTKLIFGYMYGVFCFYPFDQSIPVFGLEVLDFIGLQYPLDIFELYICSSSNNLNPIIFVYYLTISDSYFINPKHTHSQQVKSVKTRKLRSENSLLGPSNSPNLSQKYRGPKLHSNSIIIESSSINSSPSKIIIN